jgi:membrane dipeptidase
MPGPFRAAALVLASLAAAPMSGADQAARDLHDRILTIDTHIDIGPQYATDAFDPATWTQAQADLPKMRAGGLDAAFFIVYTPQARLDDAGFAAARQTAEDKYAAIRRMIDANPDVIALATTADQVEAIAASGRLVALIGLENAFPLGPRVDDVPMWADRGVRYVGLTHFGNNQFGGSSNPVPPLGDPADDPGLSELGHDLVTALNDHGIMVDISHVGRTTGLDAIAASRAPVIASHSGARAVFDHSRNLDDEQLRAIAAKGGVAQMVAYRSYIARVDPQTRAAQRALAERMNLHTAAGRRAATAEIYGSYITQLAEIYATNPDVTLKVLIDHVDHAVSVAGIDHVGLVSDFDGGGGVGGWNDASQSANVTHALLARGYTEDEIAKLWGGNVLRVMRAVEAAATR